MRNGDEGNDVMLIMRLISMPAGEPVDVTFNDETKFDIHPGAEGATVLVLWHGGVQRILHVRETPEQISAARNMALGYAQ